MSCGNKFFTEMTTRCRHWSWFRQSYPVGVDRTGSVIVPRIKTTPPRVVSISKANHMAATGHKSTDSVAPGRSRYRHCLLISALPTVASLQEALCVLTCCVVKLFILNSVRPQYCVTITFHSWTREAFALAASWPIDFVTCNLFDPPIYLSIPSAIGTLRLAN